jgi:hypothetical protein
MSKYPECEKMVAVQDKSQAIGEFIEWLQHYKEYEICHICPEEGEYAPIYFSTEELLAEFFEIDLKKVEKERRKMLKELGDA